MAARRSSVVQLRKAGAGKPLPVDAESEVGETKMKRTINTSACTPSASEQCIDTAISKICNKTWKRNNKSESNNDDAYFVIQRESLFKRIETMSAHSLVSKFPGMHSLCEKGHYTRCMNFAVSLMPGGYENVTFWPDTWVIPDEMDAVQRSMEQVTKKHSGKGSPPIWIVKPEGGMQGTDIFLVDGFEMLVDKMKTRWTSGDWVVQEYILNPLLVDGLKFDLRLYVTLISLDPLKVYICREGLARFCTKPYVPPNPRKLVQVNNDLMAHLTNYSQQKKSEKFVFAGPGALQENNSSSKRPMSVLLKQLRSKGLTAPNGQSFDENSFWDKIEECVGATITAMMPVLRVSYARYFQCTSEELSSKPCQAFQILGVDVMLRDDFSPILIEVNNSPSLNLSQEMPANATFSNDLPPIKKGKKKAFRPPSPPPRVSTPQKVPSPVDEHVKTIVVGGTLEMLPKLGDRAKGDLRSGFFAKQPRQSVVKKWWFETSESPEHATVREVLNKIEIVFNRCGGASKAFTAGELRKIFSAVPGFIKAGRVSKSDIDIVAAKFKDRAKPAPKEKNSERGMAKDLAVLEWGVAVCEIVVKRYGNSNLLARMEKVLAAMVKLSARRSRGKSDSLPRAAEKRSSANPRDDAEGAAKTSPVKKEHRSALKKDRSKAADHKVGVTSPTSPTARPPPQKTATHRASTRPPRPAPQRAVKKPAQVRDSKPKEDSTSGGVGTSVKKDRLSREPKTVSPKMPKRPEPADEEPSEYETDTESEDSEDSD
eukprot:m.62553 g.62553  ORF g.62553 m.62553 type:complete len:767 (+) comp9616_c0_seq1:366-2666(+)